MTNVPGFGVHQYSTGQTRRGRNRSLISWIKGNMTRQSKEVAWQGQLNNILKTGKNQESKARQASIQKSERGSLEANHIRMEIPVWRLDSLSSYFSPLTFHPEGEC